MKTFLLRYNPKDKWKLAKLFSDLDRMSLERFGKNDRFVYDSSRNKTINITLIKNLFDDLKDASRINKTDQHNKKIA